MTICIYPDNSGVIIIILLESDYVHKIDDLTKYKTYVLNLSLLLHWFENALQNIIWTSSTARRCSEAREGEKEKKNKKKRECKTKKLWWK